VQDLAADAHPAVIREATGAKPKRRNLDRTTASDARPELLDRAQIRRYAESPAPREDVPATCDRPCARATARLCRSRRLRAFRSRLRRPESHLGRGLGGRLERRPGGSRREVGDHQPGHEAEGDEGDPAPRPTVTRRSRRGRRRTGRPGLFGRRCRGRRCRWSDCNRRRVRHGQRQQRRREECLPWPFGKSRQRLQPELWRDEDELRTDRLMPKEVRFSRLRDGIRSGASRQGSGSRRKVHADVALTIG
jgi:hypothetical protein